MEKYCINCGETIPNRSRKCPKCGVNLRKANKTAEFIYDKSYPQEEPSQEYKITTAFQNKNFLQKKNIFMIFPFFLIPGIGFMYAGKMKKGIKFLLIFLMIVFIDVFTKVVLQNYFLVFAVIPAYLTVIIWGIVGTVKELKTYNQNIEKVMVKQYQMNIQK
ncbi:MAG: hypothetical protein ACFFDS_09900 [Candidatus Thorarchaeota archaeon]